jgi:ribosome-binding factor A
VAEVKRSVRVAERLREQLSALISRKVRDPRAQNAIVTRVEMPDDLRSARVYVRTLEGDPLRGEAAVQALGKASGLLRSEATRALGLRFAPELSFVYDSGQDAATRIDEILHEIAEEKKKR